MNTDNTYTRTVDAPDAGAAQEAVKVLAKAEGYRVRTVRSVRLMVAPVQTASARYRVELAVGRS